MRSAAPGHTLDNASPARQRRTALQHPAAKIVEEDDQASARLGDDREEFLDSLVEEEFQVQLARPEQVVQKAGQAAFVAINQDGAEVGSIHLGLLGRKDLQP